MMEHCNPDRQCSCSASDGRRARTAIAGSSTSMQLKIKQYPSDVPSRWTVAVSPAPVEVLPHT